MPDLAANLRTWGTLAWAQQRSKRPLLCRLSIHRPAVGVEERVGVRLDSGIGVYDVQKGRRMCRRCGYQFRGKGPQNGGTE